jgi:hypothetical protein
MYNCEQSSRAFILACNHVKWWRGISKDSDVIRVSMAVVSTGYVGGGVKFSRARQLLVFDTSARLHGRLSNILFVAKTYQYCECPYLTSFFLSNLSIVLHVCSI